MTDSDLVEEYFDELSRRGHDPLLGRNYDTVRFEIVDDGGHTDEWLVALNGGDIGVSRGDGDADWVVRVERKELSRIIHGDTSVLAAHVRGTFVVSKEDPSRCFGLLMRLFAGPPESRRQLIHNQRG
jgi:hypothetical protein